MYFRELGAKQLFMLTRSTVFYSLIIGALISCTTKLSVTRVKDNETQVGQIYYLPTSVHQINLNRQLLVCKTIEPQNYLGKIWLKEQANELGKLQEGTADQRALLPSNLNTVLSDPILKREQLNIELSEAGFSLTKFISLTAAEKSALLKVEPVLEALFKALRKIETGDLQADIQIKTTATVTPNFLPDLSHAYAIDYSSMTNGMKKTTYDVEKYPNGTLKSMNVVIDDQTGSVIQSTLTGVINIAKMAGGIPSLPTPQSATVNVQSFEAWSKTSPKVKPPELCNQKTRVLLAKKKLYDSEATGSNKTILATKAEITKTTASLTAKKAEKATLEKALVAVPDSEPAKKPPIQKKIEDAKKKIKILEESLEAHKKTVKMAETALAKSNKKFAETLKHLTLSNSISFSASKSNREVLIPGQKEAATTWLDEKVQEKYCRVADNKCTDGIPPPLFAATAVQVGGEPTPVAEPPKGNVGHLTYREPASALLVICQSHSCLGENSQINIEPEKIVFSNVMDFPQLGVLSTLPLENGSFQNNTLTASFSKSGSLTKLVYESNSTVKAASQSFAESTEKLIEYSKAKQTAETARFTNSKSEVEAETELILSQIELEQARADLDRTRAGEVIPDPAPDLDDGEDEGESDGGGE